MAVRGFIEEGVNPPGGVAASQLAGYPSDSTKYLDGTGGWTVPSGGGSGGELTYDQWTTTVNITATTEATANTIVTASAYTFDGATVALIEFFCPFVTTSATANQVVRLWLYEDGSSIGELARVRGYTTAASFQHTVTASRHMTPSAASHTYSIRGSNTIAGTSSASADTGGAGLLVPGYIRIAVP